MKKLLLNLMLAGLMIPLAAKAQTQALVLHHADGSTTDMSTLHARMRGTDIG